MARGCRDGKRRVDALGIAGRPLQDLHATHGPASDAGQGGDTQVIQQHRLRADHVPDGDDGELKPIGLAGRRVDVMRPARAHAPADDIGADDLEAVRIDRQARPDHRRPPSGLAGNRMRARRILVAGQRVAKQHGIGLVGVQAPESLPRNRQRRDAPTGVQRQMLRGREGERLTRRFACDI